LTEGVFTFPPDLRLRKPAEYKKVFAKPVRSTDKYFTLLAIRNPLHHPRLGLAIAKKNIKKSVERNPIKRAIKESFRLHQHHLGNLDIVVMARSNAAKVPQKQLAYSLERHWNRLKDRCDSCS
jgi:ribonuclease P protein component